MKIKICTDKNEVISYIQLTKKDVKERVWSKYGKVELRKTGKEGDFECFTWTSDGHNDNDIVLNYEYINGFVEPSNPNMRIIMKKLMEDKEWLETVEKLKKFVDKYFEQILKQ